jgi:hypothetical protein
LTLIGVQSSYNERIASTKTKADHEALPAHHDEEAKTLLKKSEEHLKMANRYEKNRAYS